MDPNEHFLKSGILNIYRNNGDKPTEIKVFRSEVSGRYPEKLKYLQWFVNVADGRLFIGNINEKPIEYKLEQII